MFVSPIPKWPTSWPKARSIGLRLPVSAIARAIVNLFGSQLKQTKLAAISPLTADVLRSAGYEPAAVAEVYTGAGLVKAITSGQFDPPK